MFTFTAPHRIQIPDYMHETGLRLSLVAGRNKTEIPLHEGELYENKRVGWNFTIEAAFLLSRQCLVTTKKAAVALGMILKQLFGLTICLEKDDVSSGICYF